MTITEYYDMLIAEKNSMSSLSALQPNIDSSQTLLNDLTTTSKVSRWRLFVWLMAFALWFQEAILTRLAKDTEQGTPAWYKRIALDFQYGDNLTLVDNVPVYNPIVAANRIIKLVAVIEPPLGGIIYKVAALDNSNNPIALTSPQMTAFQAYIALKKMAGTPVQFISQQADDLRLALRIFYNPLILASDGSLLSDSAVFPVNDAINDYLRQINVDNFDGRLYLDILVMRVKEAQGVNHVVKISAEAKPFYESSANYINIMAASDQSYNPEAGHLRISTASGETLADLIQYQA